MNAQPELQQFVVGENFAFTATVVATDNIDRPFDPPQELRLLVVAAENARAVVSSYSLTFADGQAQQRIDAVSLIEQGIDGRIDLLLVPLPGAVVQTTATVELRAVPVLRAVRVISSPTLYVVDSGATEQRIEVTVELIYAGSAADSTTLALTVAAAVSSANIVEITDPVFTDSRISAQASFLASLGDAQRTTLVISVAGVDENVVVETAAVTLTIMSELNTVIIEVSPRVVQSAELADFVFPVAVRARDMFGDPFDPVGLQLRVDMLQNAVVAPLTYSLTFSNGNRPD